MKTFIKSLTALVVALTTFVSCQDFADMDNTSKASSDEIISMDSLNPSEQSASNNYWKTLEPINWGELKSLNARFEFFNLLESQVKEMSTLELSQLVATYPLNCLVLAYNDPLIAIKLICENSNIHKELVKREDAASTLVNHFICHDCSAKEFLPITEYDFIDELFLEHFFLSGLIDISSEKELMLTAVSNKKALYQADPSMNSSLTLSQLDRLEEYLHIPDNSLSFNSRSESTIYTPTFQSLIGLVFSELTQYQINYTNTCAQLCFPNAVFISNSSRKYNCHSYAWYNTSQYNTIWLNATDSISQQFQLSKYWTPNCVYSSCNKENAEKVYYSVFDHSAIVLGPDTVISKWGQGPLMKHTYEDCPYDTTNLQFFKFDPGTCVRTPFNNITGSTQFSVNTQRTFQISKSFPGMSVNWTVQYISNPANTSSYSYTTDINNNLYLTCYVVGAYKLRADFIFNGVAVSFSDMTVVATPF